ncbi:MAG: DUF1592 domain-containing protein [Pirellulales bacterium]|nr:DUF1592 domain-containing protein [Pirellulales bacterium]
MAFARRTTHLGIVRKSVLQKRACVGVLGGIVCWMVLGLGPAEECVAREESSPAAFLSRYCSDCHRGDEPAAGISLDGEPSADVWRQVFAVVHNDAMPPADAELQPAAAERQHVLDLVALRLADELEKPVSLRRLNRREYQHTVCDLLGIDVPLAELLPEDGSTAGFDNVAGGGLSVSSILMERYLEAADAAFEATIRRIEPLPAETRRSVAMESKDNIDSVAKNKGGTIEVADSFVKFTPGWPPVRSDDARPIEDGLYRCRIAVWPHNPGDHRTLSVAVYTGSLFGPEKKRFEGMFDVTGTPDDPRIIEFETHIQAEHAIHIVPWIFPEHVTWRDGEFEQQPGVAVSWVETYGPLDQDFPSLPQRQLFGERPSLSMEVGTPVWMRFRKNVTTHSVTSSQPEVDAAAIVRAFAQRAFRRPTAEGVVEPYVALTLARLEEGRSFEQAVRAGVTAVLCAPQFLLLNSEPVVDDYTLASRLSYFLWSSMPDDELLQLAAAGRLSDPQVRREQVDRLLADERSERFVESFTGQWLDLREIEFTTPDAKLYPEFDPLLQQSMLGESRGFFRHLLDENLGLQNFIDADFSLLNQRLADHYGIEGVTGHERFQVVPLPAESVRGGVLTQAAVLKVTANGTTTSPVLRGVWVLDALLGQTTGPPPAGVPAVEPDIRGTATIREQLAKHSEDASCRHCHLRIDPPGFALESFDAIGGFRDRYRRIGQGDMPEGVRKPSYRLGPDVDPHGVMHDGRSFTGFVDFRQSLVDNPEPFVRGFTEKMIVYATGRPLTLADRPAVSAIMARAQADGLGLKDLLKAIVESELFEAL